MSMTQETAQKLKGFLDQLETFVAPFLGTPTPGIPENAVAFSGVFIGLIPPTGFLVQINTGVEFLADGETTVRTFWFKNPAVSSLQVGSRYTLTVQPDSDGNFGSQVGAKVATLWKIASAGPISG